MELAIVAILALVVAGLALTLWIRRHPAASQPDARNSNDVGGERREAADDASEAEPPSRSDVVPVQGLLVPLDDPEFPGLALHVGEGEFLPGIAEPVQRTPGSLGAHVHSHAQVAGGINVGIQMTNGVHQGANLVRLSDSTMQAMQNGAKTIQNSSGFNIGVLRGEGGQFVKQVEWAKAGSVVTTAAALGNAITMAMIQAQLNAISDQLRALDSKVDRMIESHKNELAADREAAISNVLRLQEQAVASGIVTDQMMATISGGDAKELDSELLRMEKELRSLLANEQGLYGDPGARLKWLGSDGVEAVSILLDLLPTVRAWAIAQSLHAMHYLSSGSETELAAQANRSAADHLVRQTRARLTQVGVLAAELAGEIDRILRFAEKTGRVVRLNEKAVQAVLPYEAKAEKTQQLIAVLRRHLEVAGIRIPSVPDIPAVREIGSEAPGQPDWREIVPLLLRPDEEVQLIVHGKGIGGHHNLRWAPSVVLITDRRLLGFRTKKFVAKGLLDLNEPREGAAIRVEAKTAYSSPQVRFTLQESPSGYIGGRHVDLEVPEGKQAYMVNEVRDALNGDVRGVRVGPNSGDYVDLLGGGKRPAAIAEGHTAASTAGESDDEVTFEIVSG